MSRYDVNSSNTNRHVRFRVESNVTGGSSADADVALFGMLKGHSMGHPSYDQLATTPTANQELAQLRTSLVVRALSAYTKPVGVELADDSAGTGGITANFAPALIITFEVDSQGEYFNQNWTGNTTLAKHVVADITDVLGTGGMTTPKTKSGLNSLLASLATVSYDGGTTGPFGTLSASGAIVLPNGQTTSSAPTLATAGGVANNASGLEVFWIGQ